MKKPPPLKDPSEVFKALEQIDPKLSEEERVKAFNLIVGGFLESVGRLTPEQKAYLKKQRN
jgi:hypothetical protein